MKNRMEDIEKKIEEGRQFDTYLQYVKDKVLEPTQLGNGNSMRDAYQGLEGKVDSINTSISDSLRDYERRKGASGDIRTYALDVISKVSDSLDQMEVYCSQFGYTPFATKKRSNECEPSQTNDSFNSNLGVNTTPVEMSDMSNNSLPPRKFIAKQLKFDGND